MKLTANHVCSIRFMCRPSDEPERGTIYGFWTGEIDTWGKLTIQQVNGPTVFLFSDEIKAIREVRK